MAVEGNRRLWRVDGMDAEYAYFSCGSWTKPESDLRYDVIVSRTPPFEIHCSCMGAVCHRKVGYALQAGSECKHITYLRECLADLMRRNGG